MSCPATVVKVIKALKVTAIWRKDCMIATLLLMNTGDGVAVGRVAGGGVTEATGVFEGTTLGVGEDGAGLTLAVGGVLELV